MNSEPHNQRIAKQEESELMITPLNNADLIESISALRELFSSCLGPNGSLKNIHNNSGGHVTVTSVCSRILQNTSFSKPILRLIVTSIENHLRNYMDNGIFAGLLCLLLIQEFMKKDFHKHLITDTLELFLDECVKFMNSSGCSKVTLSLGQTNHMLSLVKSVIGTKPLCSFTNSELSLISRLVVETFLTSAVADNSAANYSSTTPGSVQYVLLEGYKIEESHLVDGLLFEMPQIPTYKKALFEFWTVKDDKDCEELIKVMLLDVSMAGDSGNFIDTTYELHEDICFSDVVLNQLMELAKYIVDNSVGILACQKVVHPKIKKYLHENNVFVVERLGAQFVKPFSKLSGAKCYGSLNIPVNQEHFGYLKSARHCVYKSRSFVQFESNTSNNVCTVVLCHRNEEALEETKVVFQSALHTLHISMREPVCLYGAGCWQTQLAAFLSSKVSKHSNIWAEELGTSELVIKEICRVYTSVLFKTVHALDTEMNHITDSLYYHHWQVPLGSSVEESSSKNFYCSCGHFKFVEGMIFKFIGQENCGIDSFLDLSGKVSELCLEENDGHVVLDCFRSSVHALQTGVGTACMVLGIETIVKEK